MKALAHALCARVLDAESFDAADTGEHYRLRDLVAAADAAAGPVATAASYDYIEGTSLAEVEDTLLNDDHWRSRVLGEGG